jgi:putative transcriptional regulator
MRDELLQKTVLALRKKGFLTSSFFEFKSCFDLVAKNSEFFFVIKILENADALREESAEELKKIAVVFRAFPLLVAEKTKAFQLKQGIVYERYGIPLVSFGTLGEILEKNALVSFSFKGKELVSLDPELLRNRREEKGWNLKELGRKIGVSAETIHRYEKGQKAEIGHAKKIVEKLGNGIIQETHLFSVPFQKTVFDSRFEESALEKIHDLGMELALFKHSPFRAFGKPEEPFLINLGKEKKELQRKALVLEKTKTIFKGHSIVISKEYKIKSIAQTPVFQEEELDSYTKLRQLLEETKNREKMAAKNRG